MGGLYYPSQQKFVAVGSKDGTTRTSTALTTSYQSESSSNPTKSFQCAGFSKVNFDILYTMGSGESGNTIEFKVEGSPDGSNWYRLANESASSGTSTLYAREFTHTGNDASTSAISLGLDIFYKYLRISFKEGGTVDSNAGTVYCEVTLSGK